MELRNLAWHRTMISRIVSQKDEPDQDFRGSSNAPYAPIDSAFNEAQVRERNLALIDGSSKAFEETVQLTWPASQATLELPTFIDRESIVRLWDVTNNSAGYTIPITRRGLNGRVCFKDNRTLQWATTGPASALTVEIAYAAEAITLTDPAQEASLFPYNHRHLLNWSAAVILLTIADQRVPPKWEETLDELRSTFHLALSRGAPTETNPPRIRNHRIMRGGR